MTVRGAPNGTRMTERRARLPKAWVRAIAWVLGGATFLSIAGVFGAAPKPAVSAPDTQTAAPRRVIVRRIVRRIVIVAAPTAPVTASVPSPASSSQGRGGGSSNPPAPPTTSTGGS